jgi:hypothetical protein
MRRLNKRAPRIAGLLALVMGAVALLALSGVAAAKDHNDRRGDDHGRHHHHHHRSLNEAGRIASFDTTTGKLTITTLDGSSVTGLVTEDTRITCEGVDDHFDRRDHGGGGGDNSGPGNSGDGGGRGGDDNGGQAEPGDNHGGQNEPGDDNGNDGEGEQAPPTEGPAPVEGECTTASLVPGTAVGDAELRIGGGTPVFTEVELGHDS